jgi:hypothetical protein
MAAPPAPGRARSRDPVHGRMNAVPAHMAYAVTSKLVYRASSGFWAVWKMAWSTAAASTTSADTPNPSPCEAAMSAVPASAIALPAHRRRPARSPRNVTASKLEYTGAVATSSDAVPAGTTRSPALSSSWYPVIPASPHTAISGRSRRAGLRTASAGPRIPSAGLRTRSSAAASASAAEATASRATASPAGPSPATATVMAGNALAHSTTVPAAARFASLLMEPQSRDTFT